MSQGVLDLIQAIDSGDSVAIESAFNAEMAARVSERLEDMRVDVAKNMFATEQMVEEEAEQLVEDDRELLRKHSKQAGLNSPSNIHAAHKSGNKIHVAWHDSDAGSEHHVSTFHIGKNGHGGDYDGAPSSSHKTKAEAIAAAKKASGLKESNQLDEMISEVLSKDQPAGDWIKDFVKSDDPKFAGKSEAKRKEMALAAYYAKQKNEELEVNDLVDYLSENEEVLAELSKAMLTK